MKNQIQLESLLFHCLDKRCLPEMERQKLYNGVYLGKDFPAEKCSKKPG